MSIINRYGPCIGFTLYRFFNKRAEIWFIPRNYSIVPHCHPRENVELMFIFGKTTFYRQSIHNEDDYKMLKTTWRNFLQKFSVKYFDRHWFETTTWPLIFINFQTFLAGNKPKSAAEDFKEI